jgi:glycosyltransferase involved in cell wall biosynthesis
VTTTPAAELPLVSIITPSYNQAAYLRETLRTVAMQDYPRIEHIIMDGGSTDGSAELIAEWATTHPVRWRSEPDGGQAAAIQAGMELATGDIVAWLNSDDVYMDSSVISDVVHAMTPDVHVVTGGGWYLHEDGSKKRPIPVVPDRLNFRTLRLVDWVLQPATFVRRDLFLSCPLDRSLHFAFDWDQFVRLSQLVTFTPINRAIAGYRLHETGKTISGGERRQRELLEVIRRYNGRLSAHYLLLAAVVFGHRVAAKLPRGLGILGARSLSKFADLTHKVTNGRGIPY